MNAMAKIPGVFQLRNRVVLTVGVDLVSLVMKISR